MFKLLLHICCGPCSLYPIQTLRERNIYFTGYFYNPNIHPLQEFKARIKALEEVANQEGIEIIWDRTYGLKSFLEETLLSWERPKRCERCYYIRLEKTAKLAKSLNYTAFTTTLLQSPFQLHDLIRSIGEEIAEKYQIEFFYEDWRKGYKIGKEKAHSLGIYRQKYCGCIFSEEERFSSNSLVFQTKKD